MTTAFFGLYVTVSYMRTMDTVLQKGVNCLRLPANHSSNSQHINREEVTVQVNMNSN